MSTTKPKQQSEIGLAEHEGVGPNDAQPRKTTFAENMILMSKLLAGLGLLGGALWAVDLWIAR